MSSGASGLRLIIHDKFLATSVNLTYCITLNVWKMKKPRSIILFRELNSANLTLAIILSFLADVYCSRLKGILLSQRAISFLAVLRINIVDLSGYQCNNSRRGIEIKNSISSTILSTLFHDDKLYFRLIENILPVTEAAHLKREIEAIISSFIMSSIRKDIDFLLTALFIKEKTGKRIYVLSNSNLFSKKVYDQIGEDIKNVYPRYLSYLLYIIKIVFKSVMVQIRKLCRRIKASPSFDKNNKTINIGLGEKPDIDYSKFEILFFPHKSVAYGKLFLKDHFYSSERINPFYRERICHIEFTGTPMGEEYSKPMLQFYHSNNIPYLINIASSLPAHININAIRLLFTFCYRSIRLKHSILDKELPKKFGLLLLFYVHLKRYDELLHPFKNARIALVGYDYLFPLVLSLVLKLRNIKIIAVQERFFHAYYPDSRFILDHYFCIGSASEEQLVKNMYSSINNIYPIGPIRADLLYQYSVDKSEEKYKNIKKEHHLILALDYHSDPDEFSNYTSSIVNWRNNKAFYKDLIRLALEFPNIYIIIRGKNDEWCNISYFQDVYDIIQNMPNMEVNRNYEEFNVSYKLAAVADSVIAKHTSLGDECLAAGKPVLFYDFAVNADKIESTLFEYEGYPVFIHSYKELRDRLDQIVNHGFFMNEEQFSRMRRRFYGGSSDGKVKERLHQYLMQIYNDLAEKPNNP